VIPEDLRYTAEHEWVSGEGGGPLRVGITHFAQDALGDIVYVQLPEEGATVEAGDSFGEVESTKSVSEIYAPLAGRIVRRNDQLGDAPEMINTDPYGAGW
jgi:glycine cleavage system H protein